MEPDTLLGPITGNKGPVLRCHDTRYTIGTALGEDVLKSLSYSMKTGDFRDTIEKISVPVFYFYAVPGSLFSPELADWYREHVRTPYQAVDFPNCTHMMVNDRPHQFTREVLDVLSGR